MGFRVGYIAKCWQIIPGNGNYTKVRLSTSKKNRDTGEYEQDFSGFVMMIGRANAKAQRLQEGDRIKLGEIDVTTTYNRDQGKEYVNYKCFDFDPADDAPNQQRPSNVDSNPVEGDDDIDEEAPF